MKTHHLTFVLPLITSLLPPQTEMKHLLRCKEQTFYENKAFIIIVVLITTVVKVVVKCVTLIYTLHTFVHEYLSSLKEMFFHKTNKNMILRVEIPVSVTLMRTFLLPQLKEANF